MSIGQIDRYIIKQELGRGGMATVYLAQDPRFGRDVAIKVLSHLSQDPKARGRFEREARTIAGLEHRAIVPVYDFGEENDQLFLVMRLMPGGSLADRIQQGPIPLAETVAILERIAAALDYAHRQGIVHRDLKPGNILFDQHNAAFLADFGIAKLLEAQMTFTGSSIVGTPAYISPEQVQGDKAIDGRADIYALGAILFEMLTGKIPYDAPTPYAVFMKHVNAPPPHLAEVDANLPSHVQGVIDRAMAKNPDDRFETAGELVAALLNPAHFTPTVPLSPQARPQPPVSVHPRRGRWLVGGMVILLLFGATVGISYLIASSYFRATPTPQPIAIVTDEADEDEVVLTPITPTEIAPTATEVDEQEEEDAAATATATPESITTPTLAATSTPSPTPLPTATWTVSPTPTATNTTTPRPTTATSTPRPSATPTTVTPSLPGVVLNFESASVSWRRGDQPYGEFTRSSEQVRSGSAAGKISYEFPAVLDNYVVFLAQPMLNIGGEPTGITAWIYGDGSGHFLNLWIQDATGEVRQYTFGRINFEGWVQLTAWFDEERGWPNQHISGTDDEKLTYPVRLQAIVLDGSPDEQESMGDIYIDDLSTTNDAIP